MKNNKYGSNPPPTPRFAVVDPSLPLRQKVQKKEVVPGGGKHGCLAGCGLQWIQAANLKVQREKAGEQMPHLPPPSDLLAQGLPSTDPQPEARGHVALDSVLGEQPLKTDSRVERMENGF